MARGNHLVTQLARGALAAGLAGALLAPRQAAAEPGLSYVAPEGCPGAQEFRALVARRLRGERGTQGPAVIVGLEASGAGFRGLLMLREPSGAVASREVTGPSCAEVASALALVTAMLLDASAVQSPETPALTPPREPWRVALQGGLVAEGAVAPSTLLGPQITAELRHPEGALPPSVRLSVAYLGGSRVAVEDGFDVGFSALLAALQGCLRPRPAEGSLRMELCAGVQAGSVRAAIRRAGGESVVSKPWVAAQAAVGATVTLSPDLALRGHLGALAPFTRHSYVVHEPEELVHRPPAAAMEGGMSLVYAFP